MVPQPQPQVPRVPQPQPQQAMVPQPQPQQPRVPQPQGITEYSDENLRKWINSLLKKKRL